MRKMLVVSLFLFVGSAFSDSGRERKFFPDDPLWKEPRILVKPPVELKRSEIIDFLLSGTLHRPGGEVRPAANANTVGGVPDSDWFTNRIGRRSMSAAEVLKGPNEFEAPETSGPWLVVEPKMEGVSGGFTAKDPRGDKYFVKLDPIGYPQMASSAEVISTKFLYAFGYNVPENYLVFLTREQLRLDQEALDKGLTEEDLDNLLSKAPRGADGTYQMLASRMIEGEPIGQFKFHGTRPDDPNDIFPHQDRRELRGMRLFMAWLNNTDADTINTLDVFVSATKKTKDQDKDPEDQDKDTEETRGYLKHYLIDFGTTLGSGASQPKQPRIGYEYGVEWGPILKSALSLGLWEREWQKIVYPEYPQIGRFEAEHFRPERWRTDYPNPAFDRMCLNDAFWAAEILSRFSDSLVRQVVGVGRISDPEAEDYLVRTLLTRRDKILAYYLSRMNPISAFSVEGDLLTFENVGRQAGIGEEDGYECSWYFYDDQSGELRRISATEKTKREAVRLPKTRSKSGGYLVAQLRTLSTSKPLWAKQVLVYFRPKGQGYEIVGVDREEELNGSDDFDRRRFLAEQPEKTARRTED